MADPADPFALAAAAADAFAAEVGVAHHDVALVLGSGWGPAADRIGTTVGEVTASDLPGFPRSTVAGHGGTIRSLDADGTAVMAYFGRVHGYEGNPVSAVVHNVRTAAAGRLPHDHPHQRRRLVAHRVAPGPGRPHRRPPQPDGPFAPRRARGPRALRPPLL